METLILRKAMQAYIEEADERLLNVLKAVVESYRESDIVAYSVNGDPLTREKYRQELYEAEAEITRGEFTAQEDLEKEAENW